jgi:hypothetical protein
VIIPSPELRAELVRELVEWLEVERASLEESWEQKGISPLVSVERVLGNRIFERVAERQAVWHLDFKLKKVEVSRFFIGGGFSPNVDGNIVPASGTHRSSVRPGMRRWNAIKR